MELAKVAKPRERLTYRVDMWFSLVILESSQ
jgi:hypothetical protein